MYDLPEPLSRDELNECIRKGQAGDREARDRAITGLLRVAWKAVESYTRCYQHLSEDILSVATVSVVDGFPLLKVVDGLSCTPYIHNRARFAVSRWFTRRGNGPQEDVQHYDNIDLLPVHKDELEEDESVKAETKNLIGLMMEGLEGIPEKQQGVIREYFGIGCAAKIVTRMSEERKCSRAWINRLKKQGLKNLRENLQHIDAFRGVA